VTKAVKVIDGYSQTLVRIS